MAGTDNRFPAIFLSKMPFFPQKPPKFAKKWPDLRKMAQIFARKLSPLVFHEKVCINRLQEKSCKNVWLLAN